MKPSLPVEKASATELPAGQQSNPESILIPEAMLAAVRSDHAGETGAVAIYRGILAVTRDDSIRDFAQHHLATEYHHLELIEAILPAEHRSRLLLACYWAGWITGALPALFGAAAVYRTIDVVETFVDRHYREQTDVLSQDPTHRDLYDLLERCRADEIAHRDDARSRLGSPGLVGRIWSFIVGKGSQAGVSLVMRF